MTRKDSSKLLAAVTGVLVLAAAALSAAIDRTDRTPPARTVADTAGPAPTGSGVAVDTPPPPADSAAVARGREVFRSVGCTGCHSAEGEGRSRYPLDGVGSRLSADTLRAWVVDPRSVDPSVRKPAYDDLPEEDVDALVAYMQSLRKEPQRGS